jgi:hypothetical protein
VNKLETFDHGKYLKIPEYRALSQAIDAFVEAIPDGTTLDELQAVVNTMVLVQRYVDACSSCSDEGDRGGSHFPYAGEVEREWIHGKYKCQRGHVWTCGYAVDFQL